MHDFSLDLTSEKIHSAKTREYFQEVIKSYYNESYRSAVVMLYSITIADLLYKIEELKDQYNDKAAIEILEEIKTLQSKNQTSPEWENKLIELIKEKTNLLEVADYVNLNNLQKHRHLCAHPVLTQNFELYRPNRETTRAHIRNTLEGVLIKPAMLSRKIFNDLLADLSNMKYLLNNDQQLEAHLKIKYLKKLGNPSIKPIFRSLWKITFKTTDKLSEDNRGINLRALIIILKNNYDFLLDCIVSEIDFYSDLDIDNTYSFATLLNHFPGLFNKLNDNTKAVLVNTIQKDANLEALSSFLSTDIDSHIEKVLEINTWDNKYVNGYISTETILTLFDQIKHVGQKEKAYDFLIQIFGKSPQFNDADTRFNALIEPHLNELNKEELKKLVKAINSNSQIYDRWNAKRTNRLVKEKIEELYNKPFPFDKYYNFKV